MRTTDHVGDRLRAARQSAGLTLDALADRAQMSTSTLSRLESGKRQPSLDLLLPIVDILGLSLDTLVRRDAGDPRVVRKPFSHNGSIIAPLTREQSPVHSFKITYPVRADLPGLRSHEGFEWLYVLSGRLRLRVAESDIVLTSGEAAEFNTLLPHAMSTDGDVPAQVISMFNETGERMHLRTLDDGSDQINASIDDEPGPDASEYDA